MNLKGTCRTNYDEEVSCQEEVEWIHPAHDRPLASYTVTDVRVSSQADKFLNFAAISFLLSLPLSSTDITQHYSHSDTRV
jgi:hypothetical protein